MVSSSGFFSYIVGVWDPEFVDMKERDLYKRWEDGLPTCRSLYTREGQYVEIVSPGKRCVGTGPDFTGCVLMIDGEIWTGDVEIHLDESDWYRHGHQDHSAYENLLLHLCGSSRDPNSDPPCERTLVLTEQESRSRPNEQDDPDGSSATGDGTRCPAGRLVNGDADDLRSILSGLEKLGTERMVRRADQVPDRLNEGTGRRIIFGSVVLEALGLYRNRDPMKALGRPEILNTLYNVLSEEPPERRQQSGELVLLSIAGLLEREQKQLFSKTDPQWRLYLEKRRLLLDKYQIPASKRMNWDLSGVRPANSPYRRIAAFVALCRRWFCSPDPLHPVSRFSALLEEFSRTASGDVPDAEQLLDPLVTRPEHSASIWNVRTTPKQAHTQSARLAGFHRAGVLWVNAVFPFLLAVYKREDRDRLLRVLKRTARQCELPLGDHRVQRVQEALFGTSENAVPLTTYFEQGMHELYSDFCRYGRHGCRSCPIRSKLENKNEPDRISDRTSSPTRYSVSCG